MIVKSAALNAGGTAAPDWGSQSTVDVCSLGKACFHSSYDGVSGTEVVMLRFIGAGPSSSSDKVKSTKSRFEPLMWFWLRTYKHELYTRFTKVLANMHAQSRHGTLAATDIQSALAQRQPCTALQMVRLYSEQLGADPQVPTRKN